MPEEQSNKLKKIITKTFMDNNIIQGENWIIPWTCIYEHMANISKTFTIKQN